MKKTDRIKSLFSIFFVVTLDNFGFAIGFILFAPLIINNSHGMLAEASSITTRKLILGVLFGVFPFAQFFVAPIFGDFADRFGRKKALVITILGTIFGFLFSIAALLAKSVSALIISRFITGLFAGNLSICLAAIADLCRGEKERLRIFGYITVAFALAWIVAMVTGGYLSDPTISRYFGPTLPLWITALLSTISLFFVLRFFRETHPTKEHVEFDLLKGVRNIIAALKMKAMRPFFVVSFLRSVAWGLVIQWFAVYAIEGFGVTQKMASNGLLFIGLFWTIGGLIVGPLLLRIYTTHRVALIVFISTTILIAPCFFMRTFFLFSLFCWLAGVTSSVAMSTTLNLISISAPQEIQGKAMGLSQSVMSLGWFFVPVVGAIFGRFEPHVLYGIAAIFFAGGATILGFLPRVKSTPSQR